MEWKSSTDKNKYGNVVGEVIHHTLFEDGTITKYDVKFGNKTIKNIPTAMLEVVELQEHSHNKSEDEEEDDDDEEDDPQYKKPCCKCGHILCINTSIMCYSNTDEGDMTLCSTCYWDNKWWADDENEDNADEWKEHICERAEHPNQEEE